MEKCIEGAKRLIEHQIKNKQICNVGESFAEYQKVYAWTNEYIKGYLDLVSFTNKDSALAVMASGDHAFNLIEKGISNVDTFDTNRLTEFYALGLKRAMILKYDYKTFLEVTQRLYSDDITIAEISEIVFGLLPFMDRKHAIYWRNIIDFNMQIHVLGAYRSYKRPRDFIPSVCLFCKFIIFNHSSLAKFVNAEDGYYAYHIKDKKRSKRIGCQECVVSYMKYAHE